MRPPLLLTIALLAIGPALAGADDRPVQPDPVKEPELPPAPPPDQASGIEREAKPPLRERLRWVPRALLFFPRWIAWGVGQPFRGAAYAYEQYQLPNRWKSTFFNSAGTFGIYPVATYETGFGFTGGARLVYHDVFGKRERLKARASFGGRFRQAIGLNLRSGRRVPGASIELDSSWERRPNEPFYGIGDDTRDQVLRFQEDVVRNVASVDVPLVGSLGARFTGGAMLRDLMGSSINNARAEAELIYDSRRPATVYASRVIDATGWLVAVHGGVTRGLGSDPSEFASYGGEAQRFFDLYQGTRVLALRVLVEATSDGQTSFVDLPRLGGTELLRGYPTGRFRDRALTLATIEYTWDLGNYLAAYTFVDAGRVWPSLRDVTLETPRIGFGGGIQLHTTDAYAGRVQIAGSRAGDVMVELVLSPAFRRRERVGRF